MEHSSETLICALCGGLHALYTVKDGYRLLRCKGCGHGIIWPMPTSVEAVYDKEYFAGAKEGHGYGNYDADKEPMRNFYINALAYAESLVRKPGFIFDIGAATGFFLEIAQERGWKVAGVEISAYAAQLAQKKGIAVQSGVLKDAQLDAPVDVATLWDVIEHVQDPIQEMQQVSRILKPGGIVLFTTPDFRSGYARLLGKRWHAIVPPEHLHFFTRQSMRLLLEQTGFEVVSMEAPNKAFTFGYIFQMLARWQGLGLWKNIEGWLRKHPALGTLSLPVPLRDNMYVIARKRS